MTYKEALVYIDDEFEIMSEMGMYGKIPPALRAVLKMAFIGGMSAALAFSGDDEMLAKAMVPAMQNISAQFGGRTIFPLDGVEEAK